MIGGQVEVSSGSTVAVESKLRRYPPFVRFWLASTVSDFGTYITSVALSVLILVTMNGTALDQGLVNAARWAPYLLFGLVAGVWIDRLPRRTVLIGGDLGRGLILAGVALASAAGLLSVPGLMMLIFAFGTLALTSDAAYQSFLPQLVPRRLLTKANARLQQSDTVAQTTGGAVAGGLVALLTAPFAMLLDAVSYFLSAAVLLTLERPSQVPVRSTQPLHRKVSEGLRWVYRHPYLTPLACSTHIWFIGSSILGAVSTGGDSERSWVGCCRSRLSYGVRRDWGCPRHDSFHSSRSPVGYGPNNGRCPCSPADRDRVGGPRARRRRQGQARENRMALCCNGPGRCGPPSL